MGDQDVRLTALRAWSEAEMPTTANAVWSAVEGDAGSRRYFRLQQSSGTLIAVDAPPETANTSAFIDIRARLAAAGLGVPELFAVDLENGFMLLEDLGQVHLQDILDTDSPSPSYLGAIPLLMDVQATDTQGLAEYDQALLSEELSRFPRWFCEAFLGLELTPAFTARFADLERHLIDDAMAQPQVFVYRDYHCRNLLQRQAGGASNGLGLIDFQDAVRGPLCYDLASLLKDCYVKWPAQQAQQWALAFRQARLARKLPAAASDAEFLRWLDWIGLQRHLKVLGNFTRLAVTQDRRRYLGDVPLVLEYISEVLSRYAEFNELRVWWCEELLPQAALQDWGSPS